MKIEIEVDDRYSERNLWVFAGLEPVARRRAGGEWEVKVQPCSRCGECCAAIREDHPLGTEDGCRHLHQSRTDIVCGLGIFRPHGCAIADGSQVGVETCSVKWETVE